VIPWKTWPGDASNEGNDEIKEELDIVEKNRKRMYENNSTSSLLCAGPSCEDHAWTTLLRVLTRSGD